VDVLVCLRKQSNTKAENEKLMYPSDASQPQKSRALCACCRKLLGRSPLRLYKSDRCVLDLKPGFDLLVADSFTSVDPGLRRNQVAHPAAERRGVLCQVLRGQEGIALGHGTIG
jgi:hypothetical protein